jgi:hypothetical protein
LRRLSDEHDPQFTWAVFSGFDPGIPLDLDPLSVEPWAGNLATLDVTGRPQHPDAKIEIVSFDGGSTLVTGDDREVHRLLRAYFPETIPMPPSPGA